MLLAAQTVSLRGMAGVSLEGNKSMNTSVEFEQFWTAYPRKEAKLAALKAYQKARKMATVAEIISGVERYKARMPEERQFRPLPATFLNQGRWMDEDDVVQVPARRYWAEECAELHGGTCAKQWDHEMKKRDVAV